MLDCLRLLLSVYLISIAQLMFGQESTKIDTLPIKIDQGKDLNMTTAAVSGFSNPLKRPKVKEINFPGSFSIQTDQDYLFRFPFSRNEDRNYTQGTSFVYSHPNLMNSFIFLPFRKIKELTRFVSYGSSIALGGTAFTPRIIDSAKPIIGDRPFAFLLYVSTSATLKKQKQIIHGGKQKSIFIYNSFVMNYGIFGTNIGYSFQSFAHKHLVRGRPTDPKGWNTQISKGGAPTLLFEYNRFRPLVSLPSSTTVSVDARRVFDLGWNLGGSVGYYDRVFTGLYTRLGHLRNENQARWNAGWASLTGASYQLQNPEASKKFSKLLRLIEAFAYAKANTTLMFRNSMLVGQGFRHSDYTLKPEWTHIGLFEFEWGGVLDFEYTKKNASGPKTWAIQFRQVYRSPEFDSGIFPERWHYFGSIGLMFPFF